MSTLLADPPAAPPSEQPPAPESPGANTPLVVPSAEQRTCKKCGAPMEDAQEWCLQCGAVAPGGLAKTVFELRGFERQERNRGLDGSQLAAQLDRLRDSGARNLGYYPDDFRNGFPALEAIRPAMSRRAFPGSD